MHNGLEISKQNSKYARRISAGASLISFLYLKYAGAEVENFEEMFF